MAVKKKAGAEREPQVRVERLVRVRYRPMLKAFRICVNAMKPLKDEERRRVINATSVAIGLASVHISANDKLRHGGDNQKPL